MNGRNDGGRTAPAPGAAPGAVARALRTERGLTQEQVARQAAVTQAAVSFVEAGRAGPGTESFALVAAALRASPAAMLGDCARCGGTGYPGFRCLLCGREGLGEPAPAEPRPAMAVSRRTRRRDRDAGPLLDQERSAQVSEGLRARRTAARPMVTQREVAAAAGISQTTVWGLEHGIHRWRERDAEKAAVFLGTTLAELLEGETP